MHVHIICATSTTSADISSSHNNKGTSRIDYCNFFSITLPPTIYRVFNGCTTRQRGLFVSSQNSQSHASSPQTALATVARRIQYKILLLSYKITLRHAPFCLRDLLPSYQPTRCLRSSSSNALVVPRTRGKAGDSVFAGAAPRLWNALAHKLKCVANINI